MEEDHGQALRAVLIEIERSRNMTRHDSPPHARRIGGGAILAPGQAESSALAWSARNGRSRPAAACAAKAVRLLCRERPGKFWALVVAATELIAGPLLALGFFTRFAALPVFIFLALSAVAHGKRDGYYWTIHGGEYLVWAAIALFFLVNGGGALSLDRAFGFDF
jgi:uncharacterized membrane protein YphA (DoxX/SURF4 family)